MPYVIEPFLSGQKAGIPCDDWKKACHIADEFRDMLGGEYAVFGPDHELLYTTGTNSSAGVTFNDVPVSAADR